MNKYTVFVSSPSDVSKERKLLSDVIDEINATHGKPLGYALDLWKYEDRAYPSADKPQNLINAIMTPYQIFIGIMWKRFGTPTPNAGSGTEEEYNTAYKAWQRKEVREILFYFCEKNYTLSSLEEHDQVGKVLKFKNDLSGQSFIWKYSNPADFKDKIRKHLCTLMNRIVEEQTRGVGQRAAPDEVVIDDFKSLWDKMTPELQNYFNIPYNENRMKGDGGIQTRDLFAAMVTNPTPELKAIMQHIPTGALPEPIEGKIVSEPYIVNEKPWLSHCIASSIKRLGKALPEDQQLTALDVFTDIAKNGSGESVRLLRKHNINPENIEAFLQKEKLQVLKG